LDWSEHQTLPQPCVEIDHNTWFRLGICGHESEREVFHEGLYIPGESFRPFGGWSCHIRMYYTYALVDAHVYSSSGPKTNLGIWVHGTWRDEGYTVRFFKLGCDHTMVDVPEESRMCYHVSVCTKCGMRQAIDSSD